MTDLIFSQQASSEKEILRESILSLVEQYASPAAAKNFVPGKTPIPVSGKVLGSIEVKYMVEAALDGWLTTGRFNRAFEEGLSSYLGVKNLRTVNSGSSANLVAFSALTSSKLGPKAISPGDEVITVAAGFPTTVNPILQHGAIPVFLDINLGTYNVDADSLESAITEKTRAVMLAHTLGNPFDLGKVRAICKQYGLWLIEDTCDALGSRYEEKMVGSFGDVSTLSFYPAHHITMGEGGAVFTNSSRLTKIVESFRDWGRDCYCPPGEDNTCNNRFDWTSDQLGGELPEGYDHKYIYSHAGYNMKITDMQAACGLGQLAALDQFIETRKRNFKILHDALVDLSDFFILPVPEAKSEPSWFGFPLTIRPESGGRRMHLLSHLNEKLIGTRLLFGGNLTKQPYFSDKRYRIHSHLKKTDIVMDNTFWLGLYPGLGSDELNYVAEVLHDYVRNYK